MNIEFKKAGLEMAMAIHELIRQLGHERDYDDLKNDFLEKLSGENFEIFVAVDKDKVIAFAEMHYMNFLHKKSPWARLVSFCVDESFRNKQVGSDFIYFLEERCKEKGCECLELISNERRVDAHRFYERNGYAEYKKMFIKRFE